MKLHRLRSVIVLPRPREEVFAFFADPANLEVLTPPWLRFRILTPLPIEMGKGLRIDYRISLHGIPLGWTSEITAWDPPHRFVDTQVRGPYRIWIHTHRFEEAGKGTRVQDEVEYAVPGGPLVHRFLVRPDLDRIFRYRRLQLERRFGSQTRQDTSPAEAAS